MYLPGEIRRYGVLVVLWCLVAAKEAQSGDVFVERALSASCVAAGISYTTSVSVTISGPVPSGLIVQEVLPSGWIVLTATWNGSPFMPQTDQGTNKWLFGFTQPVGNGTLVYLTSVTNAYERGYRIDGAALYLNDGTNVYRATAGHSIMSSCDTDGDGMPDDWERLFFGGPTNAVAGVDSDGDGMNNHQEYLADTNPTNAASSLRLVEIVRTNNETVLQWHGGICATQYLQRSDSLGTNAVWVSVVTNWPPAPQTNIFHDTNALGSGQNFYRIRATR